MKQNNKRASTEKGRLEPTATFFELTGDMVTISIEEYAELKECNRLRFEFVKNQIVNSQGIKMVKQLHIKLNSG